VKVAQQFIAGRAGDRAKFKGVQLPPTARRFRWTEAACYHILNRGHARETVFHDDHDRGEFLDRLLLPPDFENVPETNAPPSCTAGDSGASRTRSKPATKVDNSWGESNCTSRWS
jgi:hypothetical protein